MLSDHDQRVWDDIERFWAEDAEEPDRPGLGASAPRRRPRSDVATVAGIIGARIAVVVVLLGAPVAGLALLAALAVGWAVSRAWREPGGAWDVLSLPPSASAVQAPVRVRRAVEWGRDRPYAD